MSCQVPSRIQTTIKDVVNKFICDTDYYVETSIGYDSKHDSIVVDFSNIETVMDGDKWSLSFDSGLSISKVEATVQTYLNDVLSIEIRNKAIMEAHKLMDTQELLTTLEDIQEQGEVRQYTWDVVSEAGIIKLLDDVQNTEGFSCVVYYDVLFNKYCIDFYYKQELKTSFELDAKEISNELSDKLEMTERPIELTIAQQLEIPGLEDY